MRIFQALRPDVVLIQEFNVNATRGEANDEAAVDAWVDDVFGAEYHWFREPGGDSIPNGVISRWPIIEAGEWRDDRVSNRDFTFARIDVPGEIERVPLAIVPFRGEILPGTAVLRAAVDDGPPPSNAIVTERRGGFRANIRTTATTRASASSRCPDS